MEVVPKRNDLPKDSSSEEHFDADCSSEIKDDMNDLGWKSCISPESGCRSDITQGIVKPSLKKAVKLIVVIEKMSERDDKAEHIGYDHDLLDPILLNEEIYAPNLLEIAVRTKFSNATVLIRDSRQKCLTLQEYQGTAHLVCSFLQGNNNREAKISMDALTSSLFTGPTHQVTLSIAGHGLYLSCIAAEGDQNTPVLSLMKVTDIQDKEKNDLLPFLFRRSANTNNGKNSFESIAFAGWYICTSQTENQYLEIKPESDHKHIRDFLLYPTS